MSQEADWAKSLKWSPDRPGFDRYFEDTIVVDWQTPSVLECARGLGPADGEECERAEAAFVFVRDQISQSLDVPNDALPCSASQVLRAKAGLSYAKSHLLAALLRSRGVPAGFAYQRISDPGTTTGWALHGIVVAWLSSVQSWIPLDPRGNTDGLRSEFRIQSPPSLVHEPHPDRGEVLFPRDLRPTTPACSGSFRSSGILESGPPASPVRDGRMTAARVEFVGRDA